MNLKEIKDLIELVDDKGFAEFEIKRQGFRLRISRFQQSTPQIMQLVTEPIAVTPAVSGAAVSAPTGVRRGLNAAEPQVVESIATPGQDSIEPAAAQPGLHIIKSPIVGTYYSSPSPESASFVRIGDRIELETVVCIIEAMKLMNEIQAEISGEIAKIFVENGQPVEYGQSLFGIKTD